MTRLGADGEPEEDVLRTRFRGWFALREPDQRRPGHDGGPEPTGTRSTDGLFWG
jgi:hypothetical protein